MDVRALVKREKDLKCLQTWLSNVSKSTVPDGYLRQELAALLLELVERELPITSRQLDTV
jgi:hypothetical protein